MSMQFYNVNEEYREKFYQIPKVFFTNSKYIKISNDAKMAWGILRDRLDLSIKNGWIDSKTGNIFFYYKNENLQTILNCKKDKVIKIKKELIEADLLLQERQGLNKTNKLYLVKPEVTNEDIYIIQKQENTVESSDGKEVGKTEFQNSEKSSSRSRKNRVQEVDKSESNDTEFSHTDFSNTELSETTTTQNQNTSGSSVDTQYLIKTIETEFNIKMTTSYKKRIVEILPNFDKETIEYAIEYASIHGNNPKSFLLQILKNWRQNNIKTITEAKGYKVPKNKNVTPLEITPQWLLDRKDQEQTDNQLTNENEEVNEEHEKKRAEFLKHLKERWGND